MSSDPSLRVLGFDRDEYWRSYTQHSTPVKDGAAGFIEFFEEFQRRNPVRGIEIIRAFEDGSTSSSMSCKPSTAAKSD